MTEEHKVKMSPWVPMRNPVDVATIGKLQEELGELQAVLGRCLIQGINEVNPKTGEPNKQAAGHEVADVLATISSLVNRFDLDRASINARTNTKFSWLDEWFRLIEEEAKPIKPAPASEPERKEGGFWSRLFGAAADAPPLP